MNRCAVIAVLAGAAWPFGALAQAVTRMFPAEALRGELVVVQPPEVTVSGQPARLAPGARIRGANNLLQMSGSMVGVPLVVNYTLDAYGLVHQVWVLSDDERSRQPWPTTREEAARWLFDWSAQSWTRR